MHQSTILLAAALTTASALTHAASAQTLAPDFAGDYSIVDLGNPTGVPSNLGGVEFLDDDTLLIGGAANGAAGSIYQIDVTRDATTSVITGFSGPATLYATAPNIDGGLSFGPGGVLFYTGYSQNQLGQIEPGSAAPDRVIDLSPLGVTSSVGALQFVPSGFAGAGQLKVASYNASTWYTLDLAADGNGTYDVTNVSAPLNLSGGPEGIVYISDDNDGFDADSVLVSEYSGGSVGTYEIDANGDPIVSTRRDFITGLTGAEGAVIDPVTGDFLFSTFGGGNRVVLVTGFTIPEPASAGLLLTAGGTLLLRRRR